MSKQQHSISFNTALFNYYKLKREQEEKFNKEKAKLIKNVVLTTKEKRERLRDLEKKCPSCGKNGGIIFSQDKNLLIAKCGNSLKPCKLDIQLQKATYQNLNNQISNINQNIKNNKIQTVKSKFNFLFGYDKEEIVLQDFNKLKAQLIQEVKKYQDIFSKYIDIIAPKDPIEKNDRLLLLINEFKELIKKYETTNDSIYLREALDIYLQSIIKITKEIRDIKYKYNGIYNNEKENTHNLIQDVFTLDQLVVPIANSENKIISYIT